MTAQELRIGNLVKRRYWNPYPNNEKFELQICKIVALGKEIAIVVDLNGKSELKIFYSDLQPIPLTEEWLLKFGYNEEDLSQGKIIKGINGGYIITNLSNKEIFYVHKLQNIHYELKDKELTYNGK